MKRLTLFALATCLAVLSVNAQNVFQLKEIKQKKDSELSEKILDYQIVEFDSKALFDFRQQFEHRLSFELKTDAKQSRIFNLQAKEMRSDDYILQVSENGQLKSLKRNKTPVFQGEMDGQDYGSSVFTIDENFVMGFWQEGTVVYYLEPLWRLLPDAPRNQYIIYKGKDIVIPEGFCGLTAETIAEQRKRQQKEQQEQPQEKAAGPCLQVEIALAADFEMFQALGSVASVESFMLGTLGNVQTNYDDEFDNELQYEVVTTFVANSNSTDPWTNNSDAGTLLDDFTGWGNGGGFGGVVYDVAAIWTDRNFNGSTIGVAWLSSICTNLRYHALERFSTNAALLRVVWAHELGHNFDAPHDGSGGFIMSPSVNSTTTWSTLSLNRINAFVPSRTCLTATCGGGGGGIVFPTSAFSAFPQSGCAPLEVEFTDDSTGPPDFWEWDFPGGSPNFSSVQNPTVTYTTAGIFDVTLTVFNIEGNDTHTEFDFIAILDVPIPDFTVTVAGFDADFFNTSTNADFYDWNFGDGNFSTEENPLHTYNSPGEYEVTLTVSNDCGSETFTQIIIIESPIFADFEVSEDIGCLPLEVQFFDTSDGTPIFWEWNFPGGNPTSSDLSDPFVIYSSTGVFDVSLTVGDGFETDITTKEAFITVFSDAVADFDVSATPGNYTPNITNNSIDADNYDWDFGDFETSTEANPSHTYAAAGEYTITLTVSNFCGTNTISHTIIITDPIDPSFTISDTLGCVPHTVVFEANPIEEGNTYAWVFEGGDPATSTSSTPTVVYETAGSFDVSLTISNDTGTVTSTQQDAVVVDTLPQAAFTFLNTPGSAEVTFANTSINIDTSFWDFGDGALSMMTNPTHSYTAAGSYNTSLIVKNECGADTTTMEITIIFVPEPAIAISATTGCAPLTVNYQASPVAEGNTYAWVFNGGDPATSTEANPSVVYMNAGTYEASLTVTNIAGSATVTETDILVVNNSPQAAFTVSNTLGSGEVIFTNASTNADSYAWDFGDENTSTDENPTHTYAAAGTYTVTLTTTNECGSNEFTMDLTIVFRPFAVIQASVIEGCVPQVVDFQASTEEGYTYEWTFSGGEPALSSDPNVSVTYNEAGNFPVTLTVRNAAGVSSAFTTISIASTPTASFDFDVNGLTASFTNTSVNATSYSWNIAGTIVGEENPSYIFPDVGEYEVILTAENDCGSHQFSAVIIVEGSAPSVNFVTENNEGCAPLEVSFASTIEDADSFEWIFEGGNPATSDATNPSITYTEAGVYNVTLIATNVFGTTAFSLPDVVIVNEQTVAGFSFDLNGATAQFQNTSTAANTIGWLFPDGTTSSENSLDFTFPGNGVYDVTLAAEGFCNTDTDTQTITIDGALPVIEIESDKQSGCLPFTVIFTDLSTESPTSRTWTFSGGNPATSEEQSVEVTYNTVGIYPVSLVVANEFGSTLQEWPDFITIIDVPETPDFTINFTDDTSGEVIVIDPNAAYTYSWDFGNGQTATGQSASYNYTEEGTYTVTLTATNDCGETTATQEVIVLIDGVNTPVWASSLSLFPNPTQGNIQLVARGWLTSGKIGLSLINVLGQKMEQQEFNVTSGQWNQSFDWHHLPAGTYLLQLNWGTEVWSQKVIKL